MAETEKQALERFTKAMYAKLVKRRKRYKPFGWLDPKYRSVGELEHHLFQEVEEFKEAKGGKQERGEAVDIALLAFMNWHRSEFDSKRK